MIVVKKDSKNRKRKIKTSDAIINKILIRLNELEDRLNERDRADLAGYPGGE